MKKLFLTLAFFSVICFSSQADYTTEILSSCVNHDLLVVKFYNEIKNGEIYFLSYPPPADVEEYCTAYTKYDGGIKQQDTDQFVTFEYKDTTKGFFPVPRPIY